MNRVTRSLDRLFRTLGYRVIPNWRYEPNTLDAHLRLLFETLRISCVIDVGANTGQYRDLLRNEVGYDGWIASFEPVKANFEALAAKATTDHRWCVFDCALGAAAGSAEINVMQDTQFSSLLAPAETQLAQFEAKNAIAYRETIRMRTLADVAVDIVQRGAPLDRCYLKLDTQGFDLEVLHGAKDFLDRVAALQMEMPLLEIYRSMPALADGLRATRELGFDATGFFPISRDPQLRLVEMDCVFTKRPA
ncbi:MAG TPA: FkbM family methyltransferase [Casimicrobiaceae bacterium]